MFFSWLLLAAITVSFMAPREELLNEATDIVCECGY
jgi:hypothetical protein